MDQSQPLGQIHALWTLEGLGELTSQTINTALNSIHPDVAITALELAPLTSNPEDVLDPCIQFPDTHQVFKARNLTRLGFTKR